MDGSCLRAYSDLYCPKRLLAFINHAALRAFGASSTSEILRRSVFNLSIPNSIKSPKIKLPLHSVAVSYTAFGAAIQA